MYVIVYPSGANNPSGNNVNSSFGERYIEGRKSFHYGIDLYAPLGAEIYAAAAGKVVVSTSHESYGNYIVIEHSQGLSSFCTLYAHLNQRIATVGQNVMAGSIIGRAGNTGHSFGAHLHFEMIDAAFDSFKNNYSNQTKYCRDPYPYLIRLEGDKLGSSAADNYKSQGYYNDPLEYINDNYNDIRRAAEQQVSLVKDQNGNLIERVGSKFFGRKCSILVSDGEGEFELDLSGLYVKFSCVKKVFSDFSPANITVYNLNASTENQIIEKAKKIKIMAGYEGNFGTIYEGVIIQCVRFKASATDFCLLIKSLDQMLIGYLGLNEKAFTSISNVTGMTKRQVMKSIADENGISYEIKSGYDQEELDKQYIRGKVVFDTASNIMRDLTNNDGSYSYIDNGVLVYDNPEVISPLAKDEIVSLDTDSGLLGFPIQSGYEITLETLINPKIKLNSLLYINNKLIRQQEWESGSDAYRLDIDGIYRVIKLEYNGETRGEDWICKISAVSQQGVASVFTADEINTLIGG